MRIALTGARARQRVPRSARIHTYTVRVTVDVARFVAIVSRYLLVPFLLSQTLARGLLELSPQPEPLGRPQYFCPGELAEATHVGAQRALC